MNYKVFVIGIELNNLRSKQYFESFLNSFGGKWIRISDGCYVVKPNNTSIQSSMDLKNRIPKSYYEDGQLFVMKTSIDAAWDAREDVSKWLYANL